jgi:hypothetical protein
LFVDPIFVGTRLGVFRIQTIFWWYPFGGSWDFCDFLLYPFGVNWGLSDFFLYSFGGFWVRVRCLRNPGVFVPQLDKEGRHFLAWVGGCISGLVICEAGEL